MFASNFPIDKLLSDYTTLFKAFQEIVKDFSAEDQHKLFYANGMTSFYLQCVHLLTVF